MKIFVTLFRYFPYGGLARDCLKIAETLRDRGHEVTIFTEKWEGPRPEGIGVRVLESDAVSNHGRALEFCRRFAEVRRHTKADAVIGFNKMPGLDLYFAADVCFAETAASKPNPVWRRLYRYTSRCRTFSRLEEAVFGPQSTTHVMFLDESQIEVYSRHYALDPARMSILPPGIDESCRFDRFTEAEKSACRQAWGIRPDERLLLQIGSDFRRKGVDRSIRALASLSEEDRSKTRLLVIGQDDADPFSRLAMNLGVSEQVHFAGGMVNAANLLASADALIHPARSENTGTVIVESLCLGIPVLVTAACGFSHYVKTSGGGIVLAGGSDDTFSQPELDRALQGFAVSGQKTLSEKARTFAVTRHFPSMRETAADLIEAAQKHPTKLFSFA